MTPTRNTPAAPPPPHRRSRLLPASLAGALVGLGLVVAGLIGGAAPAWAHAELVSANPAGGTELTGLPATVTLRFSEAVAAAQCAVTVDHAAVPVTQPAGQPAALTADLAHLPKPAGGTVTLDWRAVSSDDGHVTTGTLHYTLTTGRPGTSGPTAAGGSGATSGHGHGTGTGTGSGAWPRVVSVAVRELGYLATAVLVGGLVFVALLWPAGADEPRTRRLLVGAGIAGPVATVGGLLVQDWYAGGGLPAVLDTPFGRAWAARALLWLLAAVVLVALLQRGEAAARSAGWRAGGAVVALGLLRTTGMTGHAVETGHAVWGALADLLHLAGMAVWVGGLVVLLCGVLPRRRAAELAAVVPRFSRFALASVLAVVGSGLLLGWLLVGSPGALLSTGYGRVLLVKLALLGLVMLAALASKRYVDKRLDAALAAGGDAGGPVRVGPFVRSVAAEAVLVLGVLTAASVLVTANPGQ
jgi:copper transport protein